MFFQANVASKLCEIWKSCKLIICSTFCEVFESNVVGPKFLLRAWGRAEIYFWFNQKIEFFDGQKSDFGPLKLVGNHTKCSRNKTFTQVEFGPTLEGIQRHLFWAEIGRKVHFFSQKYWNEQICENFNSDCSHQVEVWFRPFLCVGMWHDIWVFNAFRPTLDDPKTF